LLNANRQATPLAMIVRKSTFGLCLLAPKEDLRKAL